MSEQVTIYVRLPNEGTPRRRPVGAEHGSSRCFQITRDLDPTAPGEEWEFQPGDLVIRDKRQSPSGAFMLAAVRDALRDS